MEVVVLSDVAAGRRVRACFQRIDYYPVGFQAKHGEPAPDIVVTLDLEKMEESGLPWARTVKAQLTVTAGNDAPGCSNSYSDHLAPPIVCLQWSGTLEHSSTTTGVSSSAAKYKLVAENIAKQIADSLIKEFQQRLEKEGTLPELPEAFYPPYRPAPDLPLAGFGKTEIVSSWHGLLNHNETLWRLDLDGSAIDFFNEMPQRLAAAGWKKSSSDKQYLRFTHSAATLVAYVPSQQKPLLDAPANKPFLYVQYVDRMTQDEVRAAIDQALATGVSADVLIHFERQWSQEQSQRILEMFKTQPARTPSASLTVAKLYHRLKQEDNAREELVRTRALLRTVAEYGDLQDNLKKLAKELGDEKLAEQPIDTKVFLELGFAELKPGESIAVQEIGLEEPVHFFVENSEGELETISVRAVKAPSTDTDPSQLAFVQSGEHGRSWGTSGLSHSLRFRDRYCATFSLTPLADSGRFRLEVRLSEN